MKSVTRSTPFQKALRLLSLVAFLGCAMSSRAVSGQTPPGAECDPVIDPDCHVLFFFDTSSDTMYLFIGYDVSYTVTFVSEPDPPTTTHQHFVYEAWGRSLGNRTQGNGSSPATSYQNTWCEMVDDNNNTIVSTGYVDPEQLIININCKCLAMMTCLNHTPSISCRPEDPNMPTNIDSQIFAPHCG